MRAGKGWKTAAENRKMNGCGREENCRTGWKEHSAAWKRRRNAGREYTAVELSAKILEYVKEYAEAYLGVPVDRAVISVPAYFNDVQRRETAEAGRLAGFSVERIINEPTAAALSYGISHLEEESYLMVYDLGGGTFDVTVLEMFEGVLEVKASSGDNRLGGKDFDLRLMQWLQEKFETKHGVSLEDNVFAKSRLKDAAEECKITLSEQESAVVRIPMLVQKDGQDAAVIQVFQGEHAAASRNHMVGEFTVGDIPPGPAGSEQIDVEFSYNQNGILQVSAYIVSTGKSASVTISMDSASLPDEKNSEEWKKSPIARDFRSLIRRAEKTVHVLRTGENVEKVGELETMIGQLKYAVMKEYRSRAEEIEDRLRAFLDDKGEEAGEEKR